MKVLFPYQNDAKGAVLKAIRLRLLVALIIMATGLGKTVVAAAIVRWWVKMRRTQILFLVHLWEAVGQAENEFREVLGEDGRFQFLSGKDKLDPNAHVVFSTFQTMRNRYRSFPRGSFGLVIVDECHRSKADTYEPIIEHFTPEMKFAMTATEERMDGRDVRELFGDPVYEFPLARALAEGKLADVEYRVLVDNVSQSALRHIQKLVGSGKGKITRAMIDRKVFLTERLNAIARMVKKEQATRRQTIIFCNSRKHAKAVNRHFPEAKTYYSGLPKTILTERFRAFKAGSVRTLIVINKLNEAVDIPDADLIVFLRMTESKTVWLQQLGRGLRKKHGKKNVLVLDFVANCDRVRIVGQLAKEVKMKKWLGETGESTEVHHSGLVFNFESEARDIFELLERVENLPQAGEAGTFTADNEEWGTVSVFASLLGISDQTIWDRIGSCRKRPGRDVSGIERDFFPFTDVLDACEDILDIPQAGKNGTFREDGEVWATIHVLGRMLSLGDMVIEKRIGKCRKRNGKTQGGIPKVFYALSDVRAACADVLKVYPQAGPDGTYTVKGKVWGNATALGRILGVSQPTITARLSDSPRQVGKGVQGQFFDFFALSDARRLCADLIAKVPKAGEDNTFEFNGERWGTLNALARHFSLSWKSINARSSSVRKMLGKDAGGRQSEFYAFSDVETACSGLLKELPTAGKDGTFKFDGEIWGSVYLVAERVGVSVPTIKSRASSLRVMKGKNASGLVCDFFALSTARQFFKGWRKK